MVKSVGLCFPKPQKWRPQMSFFFVYSTNIFCSFSKRSKAEIRELWLFSIKKICSNQINELCCVTLRGVSTLLSTCMCSLVSYDFLVRGCNLNLWTQYSSNSAKIWQWGWYQWGDIIVKWMLLQSWVIWISLGIANSVANNENCHSGYYRT